MNPNADNCSERRVIRVDNKIESYTDFSIFFFGLEPKENYHYFFLLINPIVTLYRNRN